MPAVVFNGETLDGTAEGELIAGVSGFGTNHTINANGGDDLILGEMDYFHTNYISATNTSLGTALNIDGSAWSTSSTNPLINTAGPHTSVYIEPGAGEQRFFAVTIGAGETIMVDVDFTRGTGWGGNTDTLVALFDADGNEVAGADDVANSDFGSFSTLDARFSYTSSAAGTYYIRVSEFGDGFFEGGEQIFLNVSVTGHTTNSSVFEAGDDIINGGDGNDTIFGIRGSDTVHGDAGNDIIVSTGEGSYFGDAGDDVIHAGLGVPEMLDGGDGVDRLDTTRFGGDYAVDLATGVTNFVGESFVNFEHLTSGVGDDTLIGTDGGNVIQGGGGNDAIHGFGGVDNLYGESGDDTLNGGEGNDFLYGGGGLDKLNGGNDDDSITMIGIVNTAAAHGGNGIDTLYLQATAAGAITVNLGGSTVQGANTMASNGFENFSFSNANDVTITGTTGDNTIITGSGDDFVIAVGGNDTISTGAGYDYISHLDLGSVDGGAGTDTIDNHQSFGGGNIYYVDIAAGISLGSFAGPYFATYANIENYIGFDDAADMVRGTDGINVIYTHGGNDTVEGGASSDVFDGGAGIDTLAYGSSLAGVTVSLGGFASGGDAAGDTLTNFENLTGSQFGDTLIGDGGANLLAGGAGDDSLDGDSFNDTLNGGTGIDTLTGGLGDDWYYVDAAGDTVTEVAGEGTADRVFASVTYTLAAGQEIETLGTTNNAGNGAINLFGNGFANNVYGNNGKNVLDGGNGNDTLIAQGGDDTLYGGIGADTMNGGLGNDWFYVDDAGDKASEAAGQGTDRVFASVSYALAPGQSIELLSTDYAGGTTAINLVGNEIANEVYGNLGDNVLNGGLGNDTISGNEGNDTLYGGIGTDTMAGGLGNDWFYVDTSTDVVSEWAGEGTDRIFTSSNYVLGAGISVETLSTDNVAGTTAITLIGNELANNVYGNFGNNSLYGSSGNDTLIAHAGNDLLNGGAGADSLSGGAGTDTFVFANTAGAGNIDTVNDYSVADDVIHIDNAVFAGLAGGALAAGAFRTGAAAADADDRVIYNSATGALFFDADGNGAGAAVQFATIATGLAMSAGEFFVI